MLILNKDGEWSVVSLAQPKESVKLGKYDKVAFLNGDGGRVWALKDATLYTIEVGVNNGIKKRLEGVVDFTVDGNEVLYRNDAGKIGLYHEGDEGGVILGATMEGDGGMVASSYAGEKYVGIVSGGKWLIYRMDNYPVYGDEIGGVKPIEKELKNGGAGEVTVSRNGEFLTVRDGGRLVVFDAELAEFSEYEYPEGELWWLDDFMLTNVENGALVVRDFDGTNKRVLVSEGVSNYPAIVTANNKWLYYVADGKIKRERVN